MHVFFVIKDIDVDHVIKSSNPETIAQFGVSVKDFLDAEEYLRAASAPYWLEISLPKLAYGVCDERTEVDILTSRARVLRAKMLNDMVVPAELPEVKELHPATLPLDRIREEAKTATARMWRQGLPSGLEGYLNKVLREHDLPHPDEYYAVAEAMKEGHKADEGKLPMHLLAPEALFGTASVLKFGADKYAPRNWENGIAFSRVFSALQRHLWAWWQGEDIDGESELNHLHHAGCCIMFLQAYVERGMHRLDDRPPTHDEVPLEEDETFEAAMAAVDKANEQYGSALQEMADEASGD